jgi:hypothetical protein
MGQEINTLRHSNSAEGCPRHVTKPPRPLTHDEKKAAEAAFQGLSYNPEWSDAARGVYEGIVDAIARLNSDPSITSAMREHAA